MSTNGPLEAKSQEESQALRSLLSRKSSSTQEFFEKTWQQQAVVFPFSDGSRTVSSPLSGGDGSWNDQMMQESPLEEIVHQGWHVLTNILNQAQDEQTISDNDADANTNGAESRHPLIFQNRELQHPDHLQSTYGSSLFAPYLDGCSVVLNHGDLLSPWIAALCQDLQKSFPHAYANTYLTPPNSQAVPPHADDRDVLVLQLVGSKVWKVYETVPVPYPYPQEQVGKEGIPVPPQVTEGPLAVSTTLQPGDVLYMPRGFVHEAHCQDNLSFHLTVALATHDWTLAGIMSQATEKILTRVVDFRKSILPQQQQHQVDDPDYESALQSQLNLAMSMLQEQITTKSILNNLNAKLDNHNRRAFALRMSRIHKARFPMLIESSDNNTSNNKSKILDGVVGPEAAKKITFSTVVRAATADERAQVMHTTSSGPRGLNVREETADAIMCIVQKIKTGDSSLKCRVIDLRYLLPPTLTNSQLVCDLSLLSLAKRCVELGAFAIVHEE
jgi:hypothetical protein